MTMGKKTIAIAGISLMAMIFIVVFLSDRSEGPMILGIRAEFLLFAVTLIGVALLHNNTLEVALTGLASTGSSAK